MIENENDNAEYVYLAFSKPNLKAPIFHDEAWALTDDWHLTYKNETYTVRKGFETDGASIPRPLWWLCGSPMDVPRLYAALVHDYLYSGGDPEATRKDADTLYRDLQITYGIPRLRAAIEYYALRLFGRSHWKGLTK